MNEMAPTYSGVFPVLADKGGRITAKNYFSLIIPPPHTDYSLCSLLNQIGKGKLNARVRNKRYESEQNLWSLTILIVN